MIYLEMARDEEHGGGTWAFTNCVWAPTRKVDGARWAYWENVINVKSGDVVLHLRGKRPNAMFVGYSLAAGNGFITTRQPPNAGIWRDYKEYYRADLCDFTPFHTPINLDDVLENRKVELEDYFYKNFKREVTEKLHIFLVMQAGKLQCLNGAYLSEMDDELIDGLFGNASNNIGDQETPPVTINNYMTVETSTQISSVHSRIGQSKFSQKIKDLYGNRCCFPGCGIDDNRFLIGAHIARWSDNNKLRGNLGNGLCFCVFHDKAFELGLFTLDEKYQIFINPKEIGIQSQITKNLLPYNGQVITLTNIKPLLDALLEHWVRVDITPI